MWYLVSMTTSEEPIKAWRMDEIVDGDIDFSKINRIVWVQADMTNEERALLKEKHVPGTLYIVDSTLPRADESRITENFWDEV